MTPQVLCLHGLGRSPADWDGVRPGLAAFGEVEAPALPPDPGAALELAAAAARPGAILVGHSLGGVLALRLASRAGLEPRALVLTGCFFPPARNGRGAGASVGDYLRHRLAFLRERRAARREGGRGAVGLGDRAGGAEALRGRAGGANALLGLARLGLRRPEFDAAAAAVDAPVLVVHAADDHYVPVDFALAAASRHQGWSASVLAGGGHHVHAAAPALWLADVAAWLRMQGAGEAPHERG